MTDRDVEFRQYLEVEILKVIKALAESHASTPEAIQGLSGATLEALQEGLAASQLYDRAKALAADQPLLGAAFAERVDEGFRRLADGLPLEDKQ